VLLLPKGVQVATNVVAGDATARGSASY